MENFKHPFGYVGTGFVSELASWLCSDRSKLEVLYKSIIFTPMAISFVGAGVIWKFIYQKKECAGIQEIGLLNAIVIALCTPQPWLIMAP